MSDLFCCRQICRPILGIHKSLTETCGNWEWGRAIPFLWIHKWDFHCSVNKEGSCFYCCILTLEAAGACAGSQCAARPRATASSWPRRTTKRRRRTCGGLAWRPRPPVGSPWGLSQSQTEGSPRGSRPAGWAPGRPLQSQKKKLVLTMKILFIFPIQQSILAQSGRKYLSYEPYSFPSSSSPLYLFILNFLQAGTI